MSRGIMACAKMNAALLEISDWREGRGGRTLGFPSDFGRRRGGRRGTDP